MVSFELVFFAAEGGVGFFEGGFGGEGAGVEFFGRFARIGEFGLEVFDGGEGSVEFGFEGFHF